MSQHPNVERVLYPGLVTFPQLELAKQQMSGFGGMVNLDIKGSLKEASRFCDKLKLFTIAPSLGGTESLITMPVTTTHYGLNQEERQERGISDKMVRMSIGLENTDDLVNDLMNALEF